MPDLMTPDELAACRARDAQWYEDQGRFVEQMPGLMDTWFLNARFDRRRLLAYIDALIAQHDLDAELLAAVTEANASYVAANDALTTRLAALVAAGDGLADRYIRLIDSGDCGNWEPREDAEVMAWRAAREGSDGPHA